MVESLLAKYPEVGAILVLLLGFAIASLVAVAAEWGIALVERIARRTDQAEMSVSKRSRGIVRRAAYLVTIAVSVVLALRTLGLGELAPLLEFLPSIVAGIAIIFLGYLGGLLTRSLVASFTGSKSDDLLPRAAQGFVIVAAVVTGLSQTALDVSFVTNIVMLILAVGLGGAALAFALGSRDYVANILARRKLTHYHIGDHIRVGDLTGTVIERTPIGIALQTEQGVADIPAEQIVSNIVIRLDP